MSLGSSSQNLAPADRAPTAPLPDELNPGTLTELIELLFFAYRDFTGEVDAQLADLSFGRAHHRVLYFVSRHPGLPVAELLDILKITKQSLARVLKQLVDGGFIVQEPGTIDRRQRLLYPTGEGARLASDLTELQMRRIAVALERAGPDAAVAIRAFLSGMVSPGDRDHVDDLLLAAAARGALAGPDA
ncbi:MAG: MarR family transcriptional regulator [Pseudomonadota bacterium]